MNDIFLEILKEYSNYKKVEIGYSLLACLVIAILYSMIKVGKEKKSLKKEKVTKYNMKKSRPKRKSRKFDIIFYLIVFAVLFFVIVMGYYIEIYPIDQDINKNTIIIYEGEFYYKTYQSSRRTYTQVIYIDSSGFEKKINVPLNLKRKIIGDSIESGSYTGKIAYGETSEFLVYFEIYD